MGWRDVVAAEEELDSASVAGVLGGALLLAGGVAMALFDEVDAVVWGGLGLGAVGLVSLAVALVLAVKSGRRPNGLGIWTVLGITIITVKFASEVWHLLR